MYIMTGGGVIIATLQRCKKHPRYRAIKAPRAKCEYCIKLWKATR